MTHLFTNRTLNMNKAAKPALFAAVLLANALTSAAPAVAQSITADVRQLEGAWTIIFTSGRVKTSGFFTRDGSMFIQNAIPNIQPGMIGMHGTGEWVRSGNGQFDLTWIYPVVNVLDGTYIGQYKDKARIHYNADGALEGDYTFEFTLADGTYQFGGGGKIGMVRVRIEPLP